MRDKSDKKQELSADAFYMSLKYRPKLKDVEFFKTVLLSFMLNLEMQ